MYLDKNVRSLSKCDPGKAYRILKRLGSQPGEDPDTGSFSVQAHIDQGLSPAQSADTTAQTFADISQEYLPLDIENKPSRVYRKIQNSKIEEKPKIFSKLISKKIKMAKAPHKGGTKTGPKTQGMGQRSQCPPQELEGRAQRTLNF